MKASKELKCKDLLIITWDYEDELKIDNKIIKVIPLWKWLLQLNGQSFKLFCSNLLFPSQFVVST
ncbi:MAG: hypothetical protein QW589_04195 [Candidatus Bathyarchaeia archaeon]